MDLKIGKVDRHIEEKNGSIYLVFDSTDKNKEVLKKYTELWNAIKNKIETMAKKVNMVKISWKLNSLQMIICQ